MPLMYAKVFAQIFDSSIANDCNLRHFFMDLLVLAEIDGVVDMTPEAIAARTRIPLEDVTRHLAELESPDPRSRSTEHEGRRIIRLDAHRDWGWRIVNYNTYRQIASEEQRRYMTRKRVRKHRKHKLLQRGACNAPVTLDNAGNAMQKQKQKKKDIKNKEVVVEVPEVLKTREFVCQWEIWMNYRRAFAKPLNWAIFFQEQLDWLTQFGPKTAAEILKTSIRNGWQGLFAPKNTPKQEKTLKDKLFEEMNNKDAYI